MSKGEGISGEAGRKLQLSSAAVLQESDPRPIVPLDPARPLYDEAGREYQVTSSSRQQVVTNSHGVFGVWDRKTGECLIANCEGTRLSNEHPTPEWIARRREAAVDVLSAMHAAAVIERVVEQSNADRKPPEIDAKAMTLVPSGRFITDNEGRKVAEMYQPGDSPAETEAIKRRIVR